MKKFEINQENGITLIALVITIIVMLILVGVTISMAVNGGLFKNAGDATRETAIKKQEELEYTNIESGKNYDYLIAKYTGETYLDPALNPTGTIPEGATYTIASTNEVLNAGDNFPETMGVGDLYEYGDYKYCYKKSWHNHGQNWYNGSDGWGVRVKDNTKSSYGKMLQSINGTELKNANAAFSNCTNLLISPTIPDSITNWSDAFYGCTALTDVPYIPESVEYLSQTFVNCSSLRNISKFPSKLKNLIGTFYGCTSLMTVPEIPKSVISLQNTFYGCTSLMTVPEIPKSVINLQNTFYGCTNLTGTITININTELDYYQFCFENTVKPIYLTGPCPYLSEIAATANNGNVTYDE